MATTLPPLPPPQPPPTDSPFSGGTSQFQVALSLIEQGYQMLSMLAPNLSPMLAQMDAAIRQQLPTSAPGGIPQPGAAAAMAPPPGVVPGPGAGSLPGAPPVGA